MSDEEGGKGGGRERGVSNLNLDIIQGNIQCELYHMKEEDFIPTIPIQIPQF